MATRSWVSGILALPQALHIKGLAVFASQEPRKYTAVMLNSFKNVGSSAVREVNSLPKRKILQRSYKVLLAQ